jgi:hypothetical protein
MKVIASILDDVHTLAKEVEKSTRRKKRLRRKHIKGAFQIARIIANGVASMVPKAVPVAVVLNGLNEVVDARELEEDAADSE